MRENEAVVQVCATVCRELLLHASEILHILDPEVGEEELIKAVAAEVARLRALSRSM
jgi:hypothetical protein